MDHGKGLRYTYVQEFCLHTPGVEAQIASCHDVEWNLHLLRDGLGGQRFAHSRRSAQEDDDALALALNDIVELGAEGLLDRREAKNQVLLVLGQVETAESILVEADVLSHRQN